MHKSEIVQENETPKILCGFEIQMGHPIPNRKPDLVLFYKTKRICQLEDFAVPAD